MGTFCAVVSSEAGKRTSIGLLLRDRTKAITKPIGQHGGAGRSVFKFIESLHVSCAPHPAHAGGNVG